MLQNAAKFQGHSFNCFWVIKWKPTSSGCKINPSPPRLGLTKHVSCECKCKFDGKNVIQIKSGIAINIGARVKNIYVKKIIFGILLHIVAKTVNI